MLLQELILAYFFQKHSELSADSLLQAIQVLRKSNSLLDLIDCKRPYGAKFKDFLLSKEKSSLELLFLRDLERGHHFTFPGHELYPKNFKFMVDPPKFLSFVGSPIWMGVPLFAVVGSRQPSSASLSWMEEVLSATLAKLHVGIVSGGARGVDQKAHAVSIRSRRPTVALLPSGLGEIYPKEFRYWAADIIEGGGAILTEYASSVGMRKHHFQARNRLISALSCGVLLVEARKKSGTMVTALRAIEQGRPVFVMPTHPTDSRGIGGLQLLLEGAQLSFSAEDLVMSVGSEIHGILDLGTEIQIRH